MKKYSGMTIAADKKSWMLNIFRYMSKHRESVQIQLSGCDMGKYRTKTVTR